MRTPDPSGPAAGEEGSAPGEAGSGEDPETPGEAGDIDISAPPETPAENEPARNTILWYIIACSAVLLLGLGGYLGIRKIRHKLQS